jgi:hypothetical protein
MDAHGQDYFNGLENQWNNKYSFVVEEKTRDPRKKDGWKFLKHRVKPEVFVINRL